MYGTILIHRTHITQLDVSTTTLPQLYCDIIKIYPK